MVTEIEGYGLLRPADIELRNSCGLGLRQAADQQLHGLDGRERAAKPCAAPKRGSTHPAAGAISLRVPER